MICRPRVPACGLLALIVWFATAAIAQTTAPVTLMTAGDGSAFLPYGQGVAAYLAKKDIRVEVRKSGGSNDNLMAVDSTPMTIGTAFMASAFEAINGTGFAAGHRHENVRALFPMYETSFQVAALRSSGLRSLADLDGKKVGVGPARGPAEGFFRAAAEVANVKPIIVNGDPAALSRQVLNGEIDALWQGAVVPIPSLTAVADQGDAIVFGLSDAEVAAVLGKLPALSPTTIPPGTYKGQAGEIKSFSAWNFVVANKDLPDEVAYAITKAVLSADDPRSDIYPTASGTRAANAANNRIVPFHPGALRFYREAGIALPAR
ncbi:MAG TPA: TAXI family TRAP transporter solute-binding subunit [Bradyrhizobium sp.]|uniref:TAXI family TRAP transporter solute-binding subunit n=1 Tax=Bradyrhizobium sp. TaxID=376 RepID=UPI002D7EA8FC|nr:TAXI family TRAP transporter solute-binding subunit [Bradyrhizobium sp.]HET7884949.1 TAXI family TRAP transporter solute-binding subunit [Bradyrhizobium sp.]